MTISRAGALYGVLRSTRNRSLNALRRLRHIDGTAYVHLTAHVEADLVAAPYVFVGAHCHLPTKTSIGRYTMLAPCVAVVGADHRWSEAGVPIQFSGRPPHPSTSIGPDVWVGRGATVIAGTTIGEGSIVAAGAVVTKDVPAYEIWGGVPARYIGQRFLDDDARSAHHSMLDGPVVPPRFVEPKAAR